jgi:hypothetical protein
MISTPQDVYHLHLSMSGSGGQQQSCQHEGVRAAHHGAVTAPCCDSAATGFEW